MHKTDEHALKKHVHKNDAPCAGERMIIRFAAEVTGGGGGGGRVHQPTKTCCAVRAAPQRVNSLYNDGFPHSWSQHASASRSLHT